MDRPQTIQPFIVPSTGIQEVISLLPPQTVMPEISLHVLPRVLRIPRTEPRRWEFSRSSVRVLLLPATTAFLEATHSFLWARLG